MHRSICEIYIPAASQVFPFTQVVLGSFGENVPQTCSVSLSSCVSNLILYSPTFSLWNAALNMLEAFQLSTPQDEKLRGTRLKSENPGVNQTASQKLTARYRSTLTSTVKRVVLSSGWALKALTLQLCWRLKIQEWCPTKLEKTLQVFHISNVYGSHSLVTHWNQNHGTFASSRFLLLTLMTLPLFLSFISRLLPYAPSKRASYWRKAAQAWHCFSWTFTKKIHPGFVSFVNPISLWWAFWDPMLKHSRV